MFYQFARNELGGLRPRGEHFEHLQDAVIRGFRRCRRGKMKTQNTLTAAGFECVEQCVVLLHLLVQFRIAPYLTEPAAVSVFGLDLAASTSPGNRG